MNIGAIQWNCKGIFKYSFLPLICLLVTRLETLLAIEKCAIVKIKKVISPGMSVVFRTAYSKVNIFKQTSRVCSQGYHHGHADRRCDPAHHFYVCGVFLYRNRVGQLHSISDNP